MSTRFGTRNVIGAIVSLVALAALLWLLHRMGWDQVAEGFLRIGVPGAAILLALGLLENLLDAVGLKLVLPMRLGLGRVMAYNCAGSLTNVLVPWEGGEVLKGGLLRQHMPAGEAITALVLWNYFSKFSRAVVVLVAALCAALGTSSIPATGIYAVMLGAVVTIVPLAIFRLVIHFGATAPIVHGLARLGILRKNGERWIEAAREVDHAVRTFAARRPRAHVGALVALGGARVAAWITYGVAIALLADPVSFATLAAIYAGISVAGYLVGVIPAKIGVLEATSYYVFLELGLDPALGLVLMLVMRVKMVVTTAIAGAGVGIAR